MMNSTWAWAFQYGVGGRGEGGLYLGRLYSNAKSRGRDIFDSELLLVFVHFEFCKIHKPLIPIYSFFFTKCSNISRKHFERFRNFALGRYLVGSLQDWRKPEAKYH